MERTLSSEPGFRPVNSLLSQFAASRRLFRRSLASLRGAEPDAVTRGWLVVTGGSVGRLGLGFIASIIIARALGPEAFGIFSVLAAVASFAGAGVDLGLTNAAVRRVSAAWSDGSGRAGDIWQTFFWLRVLIVLGVAGAGIALAGPISSMFLDVSGRELYLRLALLGVVATVLSGSVTSMLQATSRFGRLSAVLLVNSGLTVLLAVALAQAGHLTITTALLVLGIGTSLASFALAYTLLPGVWSLRPPEVKLFMYHARDLSRYGVWLWIGSLLGILALHLDLLLVNHWVAPATVGMYALAVTLANKAEVINQSLYTVLLPTASALRTHEEVSGYIRRSLIRSGGIGIGLLPAILLADPLIRLFYGDAYAAASGIFQLLLVVAILNIVLTPLLMLAFTFDRPRVVALADGTRVVALLVAGVVLIPVLETDGAVLARLAAAVAGGVVIVAFVVRQVRSRDDATVQ